MKKEKIENSYLTMIKIRKRLWSVMEKTHSTHDEFRCLLIESILLLCSILIEK